jgi:hypothetical protein
VVEVGTSKSRERLGLNNKPYRLQFIQGICSRACVPDPDDKEEEEKTRIVATL